MALGLHSAVGGGYLNSSKGENATVAGGSFYTILGHATNAVIAGGGYNTVSDASYAAISGGYSNFVSGHHSTICGGFQNRITGSESIILGGVDNLVSANFCLAMGSGVAASEDGAIAIGNTTVANGYCAMAIGQLTVADGDFSTAMGASTGAYGPYSTALGVGSIAHGFGSFAAGINGQVLHDFSFLWSDGTDAFHSAAPSTFNVLASGGYFFYTGTGVGVTLPSHSGSWSSFSDRNAKENFRSVDAPEILRRVVEMPLSTWNYKAQDKAIRHMGPMAQDFYANFGVGEDERHISTVDADGVALAAIQGLNQKLEAQLKEQRTALRATEAALQSQNAQLQALQQTVARLEQALVRATGAAANH